MSLRILWTVLEKSTMIVWTFWTVGTVWSMNFVPKLCSRQHCVKSLFNFSCSSMHLFKKTLFNFIFVRLILSNFTTVQEGFVHRTCYCLGYCGLGPGLGNCSCRRPFYFVCPLMPRSSADHSSPYFWKVSFSQEITLKWRPIQISEKRKEIGVGKISHSLS